MSGGTARAAGAALSEGHAVRPEPGVFGEMCPPRCCGMVPAAAAAQHLPATRQLSSVVCRRVVRTMVRTFGQGLYHGLYGVNISVKNSFKTGSGLRPPKRPSLWRLDTASNYTSGGWGRQSVVIWSVLLF